MTPSRKKNRGAAWALLPLALGACAPPGAPSPPPEPAAAPASTPASGSSAAASAASTLDAAVAAELLRADRAFAAASRTHGADAWAAVWAERGRLEGAETAVGPDAVRRKVAESLGAVLDRFRWQPLEAGAWWDGAGWTWGRWWIEPDADPASPTEGRYLTAWIREGGGWKVALDLSLPDCEGVEGARAFDFWIGEWAVEQRIVTLDGAWESYPATSVVRPAADGCVLIERWEGTVRFEWQEMERPERLQGASVRVYDPGTRTWRIQWMDDAGAAFGPGSVGGFQDGVGTFLGGGPQPTRIVFERPSPGRVDWRLEIERNGAWMPIWTMRFEPMGGG